MLQKHILRNVLLVIVVSLLGLTSLNFQVHAEDKIIIGWTPPDITGVFKTATDYFEKAAQDAGAHGIEVQVISQSPATHVAFADQVAIIEDYIQRKVDVIAISPIEVEVIKPAIKKANLAGIPVIVVNLLEPIEGVEVASYIGFDNTDAGRISAYALLDYFGGPGVLGKGDQVKLSPGEYLDLAWWQKLYQKVDPKVSDIKANVAIIRALHMYGIGYTSFRSQADKSFI